MTETSLHAQVAKRLRGVMGEQRLSQEKLREMCGWNRGYMTRRYTGETALDVNDMETLERCAGISMLYLLTGEGAALTDEQAMELIRSQLSGGGWSADTLQEIARTVRLSGREVLDVDES